MDAAGQRILDVGCGDGRFTLGHFGSAARVVGLDTKQEEIDKANRAISKSTPLSNDQFYFECADIVDYPLAHSSLDIAIFLRSF